MKSAFPILNLSGKPVGNPGWFKLVNAGSETEPARIDISGYIGSDPWAESSNDCPRIMAEMKAIPAGRKIDLHIHSQGGNVFEGLGIYNLLRDRRVDVTCYIKGLAASAGSFIACCAAKVVMPASARYMIHDAQTWASGDKADMEYAAKRLDEESDNIAGIYAEKTGKTKEECRALMKATTWMNGHQAKNLGFVDEVTNETVQNLAGFNFNGITNVVPDDLLQQISAGSGGTATPPPTPKPTMNRTQLEAVLSNLAIAFAATETDEQLTAKLTTYKAPIPANQDTAAGAALAQDVARITAQLDQERRDRIERTIDQHLVECRLTVAERPAALARAIKDESYLAELAARPPQLPGTEPVNAIQAGADVKDILKEFERFNEPMNAFAKGNRVDGNVIKVSAQAKTTHFINNQAKVLEVMNTNTMPASLQRQVILQVILRDFVRRLAPITAFATKFENNVLLGTNKVNVPYYDLDASASTDWVAATGYVAGDTTTSSKDITINKRKYQGMEFTSSELSRQPFINTMFLAKLKIEKLALDVFNDVLSVVTLANFGAAAYTGPASAFSSDTVSDIKLACKLWPMMGRSLFIDSAYDAALLKDNSIKNSQAYGGSGAIQDGVIPKVFGFDYYEIPTIPSNDENLTGFAVFSSAILVATAPVPPSEEVRRAGTNYELVVDPQTGLSFEYRNFGDNVKDKAGHFIECNYGYLAGVTSALKRIVSA